MTPLEAEALRQIPAQVKQVQGDSVRFEAHHKGAQVFHDEQQRVAERLERPHALFLSLGLQRTARARAKA